MRALSMSSLSTRSEDWLTEDEIAYLRHHVVHRRIPPNLRPFAHRRRAGDDGRSADAASCTDHVSDRNQLAAQNLPQIHTRRHTFITLFIP